MKMEAKEKEREVDAQMKMVVTGVEARGWMKMEVKGM